MKDIQAQTEKKLEMKKFEQEARVEYEQKCRECNAAWHEFRTQFIANFTTFDTREEIRIDQIKKKCQAACTELIDFQTYTETNLFRTELRAIQKKDTPFEELKQKFKEIDNAYSGKKHKSVLELVFSGQNLDKYKMERREEYVTYDKFKQEREQSMFDESF